MRGAIAAIQPRHCMLTRMICCKQTERSVNDFTCSSYNTLASKCTSQLEVKRSKFVAVAAPVKDEKAAFAFLSEVSDPRATHNCWAYKIRERYRFSDDGEPGGSAGRPIYAAIQSSTLDGVMVVVTRYYGGTKLGTGGLVRAYGGVAAECLRESPTLTVKTKVTMVLKLRFHLLGCVYSLMQEYDVRKEEEKYYEEEEEELNGGEGGGVEMRLIVDEDRADDLHNSITNACRGGALVSRV